MPNVLEMKSVFHMVIFNAFPITKTIRSDVKQVFLLIFFVPCLHMLGIQAVIPHHAVLNIKKQSPHQNAPEPFHQSPLNGGVD